MTESISAKREPLLVKAQYYSLLLLVFFLPFSKKIVPPLIVIWTLCFLFSGDIKGKISSVLKSTIAVMMIIFYLLHIAGMIYTSNIQAGWFDLEVKFSLLLVPLLVFGSRELISKYLDKTLIYFVLGNFAAACICFSYASYKVIFEDYHHFAIYTEFSLFLHPSYAAMYALMSLCILLWFYHTGKFKLGYKNISGWALKLLAAVTGSFFLAGIYFYSSRAGLLAFAVILIITAIYFWRSALSKMRYKLFFTLVCCGILIGVFKYNTRFQELLPFLKSHSALNYQTRDNAEIRYIMILETVEAIKENILLGVGTGDIKSTMMDRYKSKYFVAGVEENLNVHNQFLETQLGLGVLGGLLLLVIVLMPLVIGLKNKNFLQISFAFIIIVNFMFESMLNVQAGVIFYSLFNCLLISDIEKA